MSKVFITLDDDPGKGYNKDTVLLTVNYEPGRPLVANKKNPFTKAQQLADLITALVIKEKKERGWQ